MANVHFLPWFRTGLASLAEGAGDGPSSVTIDLSLTATRIDGSGDDTVSLPSRDIRLLGPGAVVGLRLEEIVRRDPAPDTSQTEPNYFASVELASADLPWRYTPGGPDAQNRLRPWLALVVVENREGIELIGGGAGGLTQLVVDDSGSELPRLEDSWAWAHVQFDGDLPGDGTDEDILQAALEARSPDLRSRLFCPRRLDPNTSYTACIVPTFLAGRSAGLGAPGSTDYRPAWEAGSVTLPVYHSWRFSTGERGDFESLVRKLTPREMSADVGLREMRVDKPGQGLPEGAEPVVFGGALVSPGGFEHLRRQEAADVEDEGWELRFELARRVDAALDVAEKPAEGDPVVAPPAYGRAYARGRRLNDAKADQSWFVSLNSRPEYRAIAGLGAQLVRRNQEEFMDMAWDAVRELREVNTQLNLSRMALEVGKVAKTRFGTMDAATRLRVSAPAFDAMPGNGTPTVQAQLAASAIPDGLFSGAARRVTRPDTGLAADGASQTPGSDVVTAFLADPVGAIGAYRDVIPPAGLQPSETPSPRFDANSGPSGTVWLSHPDASKRVREPFRAEPGTAGLVEAVDAAQNPQALLARSVRARIPALAGSGEDVPPRIAVAPRFNVPIYQRLRTESLEYLVPGVGTIPPNSMTVLYANPYFIRSLLAGMNHEMGREFLWREFPTPLDSTWFRSFWHASADDIAPIAEWRDDTISGAGSGAADAAGLVFVIRGELPQRHPKLRLYAVEAEWHAFTDGAKVAHDYRRAKPGGRVETPEFAGQLTPDTFFFGFRLRPDDVAGDNTPGSKNGGYFFAFEEMPTAPRFGLEVATEGEAFGSVPATWPTVSWANVSDPASSELARFVALDAAWLVAAGPRQSNGPEADRWAEDAASFARQTLQRPARVLFHGSAMLPDPAGAP